MQHNDLIIFGIALKLAADFYLHTRDFLSDMQISILDQVIIYLSIDMGKFA